VLREGDRLRLTDIGSDPCSHGFPPNHPRMRSLLAVPVVCKGPFVGNLYLSEKESGEQFTEQDEETLERFAVQASIVIDNADLHSRAERQNRELLALHGAGLDVTAVTSAGRPAANASSGFGGKPWERGSLPMSVSRRRSPSRSTTPRSHCPTGGGPMRARSAADTPEVMNA
jgi:hypothetical protein